MGMVLADLLTFCWKSELLLNDACRALKYPPADMSALSTAKCEGQSKKFDFVWTIEKFSLCKSEVGHFLESPEFSADPNDAQQPKWHLELHPGGDRKEANGFVSVHLRLAKCTKAAAVSAKYKCSVLNGKRQKIRGKGSNSFDKFAQGQRCGWPKFIRRGDLLLGKEELLPEDRLTIFCRVTEVVEALDMNTLSLAEAREWCQGQLKLKKFDFVWTVENFSLCKSEVGHYLKSSTFSADPNDEEQPKWYLKLYPGGDEEEAKDFVSIYLRLRKSKTPTVRARIKIAIPYTKGGKSHAIDDDKIDKFERGGDGWGWRKFIRRNTLLEQKEELLPEDRLTIFVEIGMVVETVNTEIPQYRLSEDMGAMLEDNLFTDCVICASDNEQFQAHKSVLACRSPVFAAMFGYDTAEARDAVVRIEDIGGPALGQLLKFVYTGQAPPLLAERGMAAELLAAADKYHLDRLKALCERQLCRGMDKQNVCTVLALADLHNAHTLRQHAIEYLCCEVEDA